MYTDFVQLIYDLYCRELDLDLSNDVRQNLH